MTVHEHSRRLKISQKNPEGITIVDQHPRRIQGTYLDEVEIESVVRGYDREKIVYPASKRLKRRDADKYDVLIAIWTDYFNKKFKSNLDPDMIKALIASESGFRAFEPKNKIATGIAQITDSTLKILQDSNGEAKEFIFRNISKKDLKDPNIAIPMGIRWLYRKKDLAKHTLGREPTHVEIILEYKGWLKSNSSKKKKGLESYMENYEKLKE